MGGSSSGTVPGTLNPGVSAGTPGPITTPSGTVGVAAAFLPELSPAMQAALAAGTIVLFGSVEINLPGYDLCLLDGSGQIMIGGKLFKGRDAAYGVLDSIRGVDDGGGDQAPKVTLGLIPSGDVALSALIDPALQGSPVTISVGILDPASGQAVPSPYAVFVGELDVPTVMWDKNDRRLSFAVTSVFERMFQIEEGRRLSDSFHQQVWPGELGMSHCSEVEITLAWGQNYDNTVVYTRSNIAGYAETFNRT